eukprot:715970-Pleurochrysis_carterae.AAC.1
MGKGKSAREKGKRRVAWGGRESESEKRRGRRSARVGRSNDSKGRRRGERRRGGACGRMKGRQTRRTTARADWQLLREHESAGEGQGRVSR